MRTIAVVTLLSISAHAQSVSVDITHAKHGEQVELEIDTGLDYGGWVEVWIKDGENTTLHWSGAIGGGPGPIDYTVPEPLPANSKGKKLRVKFSNPGQTSSDDDVERIS